MADDVLVSSTASYTVETEDQGGGIHRQIVGAHIISGGGTGGTSAADDADFTAGTTSGTPAIGVYESSPSSVTDGDLGVVGITQTRELKVSIEADNVGIGGGTQYTEGDIDATLTGTVALAEGPSNTATPLQLDASSHLQVDIAADSAGLATASNQTTANGLLTTIDADTSAMNTNLATLAGAVAGSEIQVDIVSGSSAGTEYTEDDAAAANPTGTAQILVRADSLAAVTSTDGDNIAARGTNNGELYVKHVDDVNIADGGNSITVDNGGTFAVQAAQSGTWNITNVSGTVSLPTGAATAANQSTANGLLTTIDADTGTISTNSSTIAGDTTSLDSKVTACDTGNVTVASSALPTGAATAANQSTIIGHVDGIETVLGTIDTDTGNIAAGYATEGSALGSGVLIQGDDGTDRTNVLVDTDGHLQVDVLSGGGGGTQYTEGDIDATLTGTIALAEGPSNTATALQVDASAHLQVDIAADSAGLATSANQSTIIGHVDGIETLLGTIDADTSSLAGCVGGTELQVDVAGALPAGTNNIGDVDVASIAAGTNLIGDVGLSGARTSGGTTIFRSIDLDESEEQIKATAGQVYWIHAMNLSASTIFLKFYNATAASVTVGTTTPVLTFPLATQGDTNGAGFTLAIPNGIAFGTAITVAATTGIADSDTGAPAANVCVVNIGYA